MTHGPCIACIHSICSNSSALVHPGRAHWLCGIPWIYQMCFYFRAPEIALKFQSPLPRIWISAGWGQSRFTVVNLQNTGFILVLSFINYRIIFHMNKSTFAPPCTCLTLSLPQVSTQRLLISENCCDYPLQSKSPPPGSHHLTMISFSPYITLLILWYSTYFPAF